MFSFYFYVFLLNFLKFKPKKSFSIAINIDFKVNDDDDGRITRRHSEETTVDPPDDRR